MDQISSRAARCATISNTIGPPRAPRTKLGIIEWAHRRESPLQRRVFAGLKAASTLSVSPIPGVHTTLLAGRRFRRGPLRLFMSNFYHEPLLRLQCVQAGKSLLLYEDMPKIIGNLAIYIGSGVTLSGAGVWIAAGSGATKELRIGDDCSIGYATEFIVGDLIQIGDHVRIANRVIFNGYDGHPLDPFARARNEPPTASGTRPITLLDHSWIGNGATILKGVTIGRGAVVASQSVVTRDVAELTVVAGNPARPIRTVPAPAGW